MIIPNRTLSTPCLRYTSPVMQRAFKSTLSSSLIQSYGQQFRRLWKQKCKASRVYLDPRCSLESFNRKLRVIPSPLTASRLYWQTQEPQYKVDKEDDTLRINLGDKEQLLHTWASLVAEKEIPTSGKLFVLCEGCDNGDFLGPTLTWLQELPEVQDMQVLVANGNEKKVLGTYHIARQIIGEEKVAPMVFDSFAVIPKILEENRHNQTLALPFRLVTAERMQRLKWFLGTRLSAMQSDSLMLCSFLQQGEETHQTLKKIGAKPMNYDKASQYIEYATQTPVNVAQMLRSQGTRTEDASSTYRTVFSKAGVEALFASETSGHLLHTIPDIRTQADDGSAINVIGAIVKSTGGQL